MSFGKRLVTLVRSNLNSLLDRTSEWERRPVRPLEELSDTELEAELERRRSRRGQAERAAGEARSTTAPRDVEREAWEEVEEALHRGSPRFRSSGARHSNTRPQAAARGGRDQDPRLARLYAQLECAYGADLDTVRRQYRTLMRKYHPDMHSGNPDKQRLATDLSQRLTMAYNELRRALEA